jgi:hypothetical protein
MLGGDTAEQCWRIAARVLPARREDAVPLRAYPAGIGGPAYSLLATLLSFPAPGAGHRAGA